MTHEEHKMAPRPGKNPTLAMIVVAGLVLLLGVAAVGVRGFHHGASGRLPSPRTAAGSGPIEASRVPDAQQPASREAGAFGHRGSDNEPGGPEREPVQSSSPRT